MDSYYTNNNEYPFYDIVQDEDGNNIILELALAGWEKDDINIVLTKDLLTISAKKIKCMGVDEDPIYLHKGISRKDFEKSFTIGADVEMGKVTFENGILKIKMERIVPEKEKPRTIKIK